MSRDLLLRKKILRELAKEPTDTITNLAIILKKHRGSVSRSIHQLKSMGFVQKNGTWQLTEIGIQEANKVFLQKDITSQTQTHGYEEEMIALAKCACGQKFEPWEFILTIYKEDLQECPNCHIKMYCSINVKVYQVEP